MVRVRPDPRPKGSKGDSSPSSRTLEVFLAEDEQELLGVVVPILDPGTANPAPGSAGTDLRDDEKGQSQTRAPLGRLNLGLITTRPPASPRIVVEGRGFGHVVRVVPAGLGERAAHP